MSTDTIVHRWYEEVWNRGRAEAIDELASPDVVAHGLADAEGVAIKGIPAFKEFYKSFRNAFPDVQIEVVESVAAGDKVAAYCRIEATHSGEGFLIPPTDRRIQFTGMCLMRVEKEKIVESWNSFDFLALMQQIGAVKVMA